MYTDNQGIHICIIVLLILIGVNLLILNIKIFSPAAIKISDIQTVANISPSESANQLAQVNGDCPLACTTQIKDATASLSNQQTSTDTITTPKNIVNIKREFYIPLGSGSTTKSTWEDLATAETLIDTANYGNIKEAYFIASLRNPTQNGYVEAQLYNVTDKHLVWFSTVKMEGPASQTITSEKIKLDNGSKLYRVQLKSSLQYQAFLDNAKIRLIID